MASSAVFLSFFFSIGCHNGKPNEKTSAKPVEMAFTLKEQSSVPNSNFAKLPPYGLLTVSNYSNIQIVDQGAIRSLYFIRDSGQRVLESRINRAQPYTLLVPYTKYMMIPHLFVPQPKRVLIIGLGGGSMVHYLTKSYPNIWIDAVDIDPVIVDLAQTHFGIEASETTHLHAKDGFDFIANSTEQYDIIYMDAFLKPSEDTDATGTHLRLKTLSFYKQIQKILSPNGVVTFNLNQHEETNADISLLDDAFGRIWSIKVPNRNNTVVIATADERRPLLKDILINADMLDKKQIHSGFNYADLASLLFEP